MTSSTPANPGSLRARTRARSRLTPLVYLAGPLAVLALFFFAPLAAMVRQSVLRTAMPGDAVAAWTLAHYARFFGDTYYLTGLAVTLGTAALVTLITVVASYPVAYGYWRAAPRLRSLLVILLLSPFYANVVVKVFGWMVLLSLISPAELLSGYFAVVLISVHRAMPFMVLLIASALSRIDPEVLESARMCGANGPRVLRTVVLPLSMPGVVAGGILVFSLSVAAYVVPALVGGSARGRFLPVLMYQQITIAQDWGFAAAIGVVLLTASALTIAIGDRVVRAAKLGRVMSGGFGG